MTTLAPFIATLALMLVGDAVWLGVVARTFYRKHIGWLMADAPNWFAAGGFYLLYGVGVTVFVVQPALASNASVGRTALMGALFGLVAYATYDLTNQATVKNWPVLVTAVDLAWGAVLTAAVAAGAVLLVRQVLS